MTFLSMLVGAVAAAAAMQVAVLDAKAQEDLDAFSCRYVEAPTAEPIGDEEGHGISVRDYSCNVTQGPLSGGVLTARAVWEIDKSGGRLLLGGAVIRTPGAIAVLQLSDGKLEYVAAANGEVTEVRTSGRGAYLLASGAAASLSGRTFTYTTKTTAPSEFYFEDRRE